MREEAEYVQPVVHGNDDGAAAGNTLPVKLHFGRGSYLQAAAEEPYKHRQPFLSLRWSPNIQIQAVLIHSRIVIYRPLTRVNVALVLSRHRLRADRGKVISGILSLPGYAWLRRAPAVFHHRRRGEWDTFVCGDTRICCRQAPDTAAFSFRGSDEWHNAALLLWLFNTAVISPRTALLLPYLP